MRLVTRSDFDGLACGVLLAEKGLVDDYLFVHPRDVQHGKVEVNENDILTNVPYAEGCGLWFDHHSSESDRLDIEKLQFTGANQQAASAAQVIWDYYGGKETFGEHLLPLLEAVNISDSASFSFDEVMKPEGWILLSFIMDPRTGLGRFKDFRIGNYQLMMDMIQYCRTQTAEEILEIPDVQERVKVYFDHQQPFREMMKQTTRTDSNLIVINWLDVDTIYCGNRFIIYGMYPDQNIHLQTLWDNEKKNVAFSCGHSIFNRSSRTNVGKLMLEYGGGGHEMVGTCQVSADEWEAALKRMTSTILNDG